jgi:methionyl-tRNA formyltransferase
LSVHGREIVKPSILKLPKHGCLNVHPYLYKYKGVDPVGRALKDGEFRASVGIHMIDDKIDSGKVLLEEFVDVAGSKSSDDIYNKLYPYYSKVLLKVLGGIHNGTKKNTQ